MKRSKTCNDLVGLARAHTLGYSHSSLTLNASRCGLRRPLSPSCRACSRPGPSTSMPDLPFDPSSDIGCLEILEEVAELPAVPALHSELSRSDIPINELSKLDLQPHLEPSAATSSPPSPGCRPYASGSPFRSSSPVNLLRKRKSEQALCALISKDDEDKEDSWSHMIDPGECDFASDGTSDEGSWSQDWSLYDGESTMVMEKGSVAKPKPGAGAAVRRCRWMQAGVSPKQEVELQTRGGDQAGGREDGVLCVGKDEAPSAFSLGRSSSSGPTSQHATSHPTAATAGCAAEAAGRASSPKGTLYPLGASAGLRFPPGCDGMEISEGETTPAPGWHASTGGFAYAPIAVSPNVVEGVQ